MQFSINLRMRNFMKRILMMMIGMVVALASSAILAAPLMAGAKIIHTGKKVGSGQSVQIAAYNDSSVVAQSDHEATIPSVPTHGSSLGKVDTSYADWGTPIVFSFIGTSR